MILFDSYAKNVRAFNFKKWPINAQYNFGPWESK